MNVLLRRMIVGPIARAVRGAAVSACAVLVGAGSAGAQDLGVKAPPQDRTVWIINATVHPVSGPAIEGGSIAFDAGRITEILPSRPGMDGDFAKRHRVIDGTGLHVYPGLIGANTQMGLIEIGAVRATLDYSETGEVSPEVRASVAVNPDSSLIPVTRSNGVLSVGVMPLGGLIPGRASVMRMDGWTHEDMTVEDDAGLVVNWPNLRPVRAFWFSRSVEQQVEDAEKALRELDRVFDTAQAYLSARGADASTPLDTRWEAMRGVLERKTPLFVRAQELEQIQSAVAWGARRGLTMVIVGGRDAASATELLVRHNVGVILSGTFRVPPREDSPYDQMESLPSVLQAAGVRWCMASTGGPFETPHERNLPYHAAKAVAAGLDPALGLRSVTLSAAELLGVSDRLGSLDKGKLATLIVTTGNPLEITSSVVHAFIDGREIDLADKHKALDAKYREKYRQLGILDRTEPAGAPGAGPGGGAAPPASRSASPSAPAR